MTIATNQQGDIKFSLKHKPTLTVTMITAVFALAAASKGVLIDTLPVKDVIREAIGGWFSWVINLGTFISGVICIVTGVVPRKPDTDNP